MRNRSRDKELRVAVCGKRNRCVPILIDHGIHQLIYDSRVKDHVRWHRLLSASEQSTTSTLQHLIGIVSRIAQPQAKVSTSIDETCYVGWDSVSRARVG